MRPLASKYAALPLLFVSLVTSLTPGCDHIRIKKQKYDLHKLGGPHSVSTHEEQHPPGMHNMTWTVDICQPLRKDKNIPPPTSALREHMCGIRTFYNPTLNPVVPVIDRVIPVAGDYEGTGGSGKPLEPHYERLKETDTSSDGLRLVLMGGSYGAQDQRAIIEFQCDEERSGNEGSEVKVRRRDAKIDEEDDKKNVTSSLTFVSYGDLDDKTKVLRLNWRTKYACEGYADRDDDDDEGGSRKGGWGFFTWFILIAFLGIATYLIFGSWLNYNRYGARGWDLLPHGDTIRDMPYLFKDWSKRWSTLWQGVV